MLNKEIYNSACQYLARREHGYKELSTKLTKKFKEQVSKQDIIDVLDHLVHKKYLSEQRACEMYVINQTKKLYGPNRIHQHLYSKGFEPQMISDTITASNIDFARLCLLCAEKKGLQDDIYARQVLYRRGFDVGQIKKALEKLAKNK